MLTLESRVELDDVTGREITDFLLEPSDASYQRWWPGTHLQFHVLRRGPSADHVGEVVWMDELVGRRHLRMAAEVVDAVPGERVVWRMRLWAVRLPVRVSIELHPLDHGVRLRHRITAGWAGLGRVLDPLWRLYLSESWGKEMDRHAHVEFARLRDLLRHDGA